MITSQNGLSIQKEYKKVTGKGVTLSAQGEPEIMAQSVSRVRSFVQAVQHFKISGIPDNAYDGSSEGRTIEDSFKKFLELNNNNKRPQNDTRPKS